MKSGEVHCSQRIYFISFMYSSALEVISYSFTKKKNFFLIFLQILAISETGHFLKLKEKIGKGDEFFLSFELTK